MELNKIVTDCAYVIDPLQTDYDLLLEIQEHIKESSSKFLIQWVKGHQEDHMDILELGFLGRLNIDCDRRAKEYLRLNSGVAPNGPVFHTHEKWGAVWGGQKITSHLKEAIHERYTHPTTLFYICKKFKWTMREFNSVAWQGKPVLLQWKLKLTCSNALNLSATNITCSAGGNTAKQFCAATHLGLLWTQ